MESFDIYGHKASYNKDTGELIVYSRQTNNRDKPVQPYTSCGYTRYRLRVDGKYKTLYAHRIIGMQFLPNPATDDKVEIDHINRDKQDNRLVNLRWANRSENLLNRGWWGKGYSRHKASNKWVVFARRKYHGLYNTEEEAKKKAEEIRAQPQ